MAVTFIEPCGDATFSTGLFTTPAGAPAIATDFVNGNHVKSIRIRPAVQDILDAPGTGVDAGGRFSVYMYFVAFPSGGASPTAGFALTGSGTPVFTLYVTTGGVLQLWAASQIGSSGSTLVLNRWYRFTVAWTISSTTVNEFRVYVNGVLDITSTNATITRTGTADWFTGNGSTDAALDYRVSDLYIDDSTALTDPGNIWVTAKRPNANGSLNQFATNGASPGGIGTGNAPWVSERPIDTATNFMSVTPTTVKTEEYTIESQARGDINITNATIVDYMGWMSATIASTSNSPVMKIIVGGTGTTKTLTTSFAFYTAIKGSSSYPAGNTDIGMSAQYTTTGHVVKLGECGIIIAYIPPATNSFFPFINP